MYPNSIGFMRSLSTKIASQDGRIDQAFWIAWGRMAVGESFDHAVNEAIRSSMLEPASKSILLDQLKVALSGGRKPKTDDLPVAYRIHEKKSKTAMVSDMWGQAVKEAKDFWNECKSKNIKINRKSLQAWLEQKGFDPHTSQNVSDTVSQYFSSISQYDKPETDLEASTMALTKLATNGEHSYSCTMAIFPKDLAEKVIKIAMSISDSSLYDPKDEKQKYGREVEPHITVKYGTHTENAEDIKNALKGIGSIRAKLGRISFFDTNDKYDVVKIDVISDDLKKANELISKKCKNTDSYPEYIPHATIAYVEKGSCLHLDGNKDLDGVEVVFDQLSFHDKDGNSTIIYLEKEKVEKKASVHPLDEKRDGAWFGLKIDVGNYHQLVRNQLMNVLEEVWKVSEKDFKRVDNLVLKTNQICRMQKAEEIIEKSKIDGERPRLCAERIYCLLKDQIKE